MKTGLGLSFLRVVNEEGYNGWAQVYARIPFEEAEVKQKGALFGVVFSKKLDNWEEKESEVMASVDEYFNLNEESGTLIGVAKLVENSFPVVAGVWLWISLVEGRRLMRVVKMGGGGVAILRRGQINDLSQDMADGRIIKGEIKSGDRVVIWTEELGEYLSDLCNLGNDDVVAGRISTGVMEKKLAVAGMCLDFVDEKKEEAVIETPEAEVVEERIGVVTDQISERPVLARRQLVGRLGVKERIVNWFEGLKTGRGRVTVVGRGGQKKKLAVWLGVLFLVLLVSSVVMGSIKMGKQKNDKRWKEFSEPIEKMIEEAGTLSKVNIVGSKKLIEDAKTSYQAGEESFRKSNYKELKELEAKLNKNWTVATGEKGAELDKVVDFQLIRDGFDGSKLSLVKDGVMIVLEPKKGVIAEVALLTKDVRIVAGKGEGLDWVDVAADEKGNFVMDKTGIGLVGKGGHMVDFDTTVLNPVSMWKFGTSLYVLDQGNKEIYRYPVVGEALGERLRWFKPGVEIKTESPVDMALDGDLWVAGVSEVEKFRRGSNEAFNLNGVPANSKFARISISEKLIALLDNENSCVVTFDKTTGAFSQKLTAEMLKTAKDIEFDSTGSLWVLVGGKMGVLK